MKVIKTIGNCCLVFLAILSVCVSLAYAYVYFFDNDFTTGTNYIDNQVPIDLVEKTEDLTQEEIDYYESRYLFNVNYFSNDKDNGIEVQEMQLNYFTDPSLTVASARGTGMQYLGDFENYTVNVETEEEANNYVVPDFYYYDTVNMLSWDGGKVAKQLNRNTILMIKIGDKPYSIQLTGQYRTWHYKAKTKLGDWLGFNFYTDTFYDYGSVFADVMKAVKSNSRGYGDYYITLDLSTYFTVYEYNEETKNWVADNISDEIFTYAVMKFHYDENGLVRSDQSLFDLVACQRNYNEDNVNTTYWQERMVYTLNESNFSYRYSDTFGGYFVSLDMSTKKLFEDMPRTKVYINIDLQSQYLTNNEINIVGIDYNGFENFEIDTLTIKGNAQTFYMLDKALYNTNLQTMKYSNGLIFDFAENSINNEYVGVVL